MPLDSSPEAARGAPVDVNLTFLSAANFATRFAGGDLRDRRTMALHALLVRLSGAMTAPVFAEWVEDLVHWLRGARRIPGMRPGETVALARLRVLLEALAELPAQRAHLRANLIRLLDACRCVTLFSDTGIPTRHGFFTESMDRLSRVLLPESPVTDDLEQLVSRLFRSAAAVDWFEQLPASRLAQLAEMLELDAREALAPLRRDLAEAALLLAVRVSQQGLANDVRTRSPKQDLRANAYYRLPEAVQAVVVAQEQGGDSVSSAVSTCREAIAACRHLTASVHASLEHTGVSVDLVYRLDLIRRCLDRLYALLALLAPEGGTAVPGASLRFALTLVRGSLRDRSATELMRTSTRLLARRVVDAAAHSGEHYLTRDRGEYHRLFDSAAGGGAITAFTALFKSLLGWAHAAPFWQGLFYSLNYAGSFIAMQLLGFTLASKQPSMTAAHLARTLAAPTDEGSEHLAPAAEKISSASRSQLAATLGNLGAIVPIAVVIDLLLRAAFGRGLLDSDAAEAVIEGLHPFRSGVVPGAAATGAALWLASLAAGAFENWSVYRRVPEALASSRVLRAALGPGRATSVARWFERRVAGFGGNVALGALMGLVPSFAAFFGLPLQMPHVAVSTGLLSFAAMERGSSGVLQADFAWAVAGIALVGLLNFGVSFALALWVALRAQERESVSLSELLRAVTALFWRSPGRFFFPPREGQGSPDVGSR